MHDQIIIAESEVRNIPPSELEDKERCFLCGNGGLMGYYKQFDSIGIINLNTGQICDIGIFSYDEESGILLEPSKQLNHTITKSGKAASTTSVSTNQERRISNVELIFTEDNSPLHDEMAATLFCDECLIKIYEPKEYPGLYDYRFDMAFVDFTSREPYPVNEFYRGYFIRDYYLNFDYSSNDRIKVLVFYSPKYS